MSVGNGDAVGGNARLGQPVTDDLHSSGVQSLVDSSATDVEPPGVVGKVARKVSDVTLSQLVELRAVGGEVVRIERGLSEHAGSNYFFLVVGDHPGVLLGLSVEIRTFEVFSTAAGKPGGDHDGGDGV